MKKDDWLGLFEQKGWLKSGKIVSPKGLKILINFGRGENTTTIYPEDIVEISDEFIVATWQDVGGYRRWTWFHWSDISSVTLRQ